MRNETPPRGLTRGADPWDGRAPVWLSFAGKGIRAGKALPAVENVGTGIARKTRFISQAKIARTLRGSAVVKIFLFIFSSL